MAHLGPIPAHPGHKAGPKLGPETKHETKYIYKTRHHNKAQTRQTVSTQLETHYAQYPGTISVHTLVTNYAQ